MSGTFITFEGCEGVGKTTQVKLLKEYLQNTGQSCLVTREPGGTKIAEEIRSMILGGNKEIHPIVEAYLFATARADHMLNFVIPALDEGIIVICDRYLDSSLAYQGVGRGLGYERVQKINEVASSYRVPDCTIFINMSPSNSFRRQKGKVIEGDRMEGEDEQFHNKVYNAFLDLSKRYAERFITIEPSIEKVETSKNIIKKLIERGLIN
ncbi:MAG: dTMP kinase [Christensenellaceae bacterium]|jgi:dTMP kinase|nr:dTMP kinase [Christensenellaceae bacterium]